VCLALPLSRRKARTFLPLRVFILLRKPCSFFLCSFFGWYVLVIYVHSFFTNGCGGFFPYDSSLYIISSMIVKDLAFV
jgi:hypothetical protein